ncbi:MAG: rhodanese-like domain-containing protein [Cryomorphaceae bacterium]|nr:rhodanese-like domain-containing protein [Cryomorphaceae bacterium]
MGIFSALFGGKQKQIKAYIDQGATLLDVRTPGEFKTGTVKGAVNVPLDKLSHNLKKIPQNKKVVVFCRTGSRSAMAKRILKQNGYDVINGGGWGSVDALV